MATRKCLLTGASGFLGRFTLHSLAMAGWQVTALGRSPVVGVQSLIVDLSVAGFDLGQQSFDAVYHLAGLAHHVPRTAVERRMFFQVNVNGTRNLLMALERLPRLPEAIVLISTVAVYGLKSGLLMDESTPCGASDPYGSSKQQAEDCLLDWCSRHGVRAGIARLPLVVGPEAPGNLGTMVKELARGRYFGIGSGAARHSMVWIQDVANILPALAACGGIFHLTDGHHPSFRELEETLCRALKRRIPRRVPLAVARLGALMGDSLGLFIGHILPLNSSNFQKMTSTLTFSDQKARATLGWKPTRVLDHATELVQQPCMSSSPSARGGLFQAAGGKGVRR